MLPSAFRRFHPTRSIAIRNLRTPVIAAAQA
jgi:hypothetical protein